MNQLAAATAYLRGVRAGLLARVEARLTKTPLAP